MSSTVTSSTSGTKKDTASGVKKSTTVRSYPGLEQLFKLAEKVVPKFASRIPTYNWFKVPGGKRKRLRAAAPEGATQFRLPFKGSNISGWTWGEGPIVYALHGWGGCTGDTQALAKLFVDRGFTVVSWDALSHGNSGPGAWGANSTSALEMMESAQHVMEKFGKPQWTLAHSLGALITIEALDASGFEPNDIPHVLLAPFTGGRESMSAALAVYVNVPPKIEDHMFDRIVAATKPHALTINLPDRALTTPTLLVHDEWDRPNPIRFARQLDAAWPGATLLETTKLGHRRILKDDKVRDTVAAFIDEHRL